MAKLLPPIPHMSHWLPSRHFVNSTLVRTYFSYLKMYKLIVFTIVVLISPTLAQNASEAISIKMMEPGDVVVIDLVNSGSSPVNQTVKVDPVKNSTEISGKNVTDIIPGSNLTSNEVATTTTKKSANETKLLEKSEQVNSTLETNTPAPPQNVTSKPEVTKASAIELERKANLTLIAEKEKLAKEQRRLAKELFYSERERIALDQFRDVLRANNITLHDYQYEDNYLVRWLRAKNLDVDQATRMLITNLKWRRHNGIDNIRNETIAQFTPLPYKVGGSDRFGNPIIMFTPTNLDLRRLLINGKNISRYWDQILEEATIEIRRRVKETGREDIQAISLMDLHGFNLIQHGCFSCFGVYINWITDYENYFPQLAKHIVWINAPRVFVAVLELVKPLMSPATAKALRVFGTDRGEWAAYLQKIIPNEQLPYRFGGSKKAKGE